ncbi:hypothetical protein FJZ33_06750 [Candidatus Poribacteria bacterium]|nr:hypothetical protein [Candidatus Poribacteria bacterium]
MFLQFFLLVLSEVSEDQVLPGTDELTIQGDLAAQMVAGIDKFLMREIENSIDQRAKLWNGDMAQRFLKNIGAVDTRLPISALEYVSDTENSALVAEGDGYYIYAIRWPVFKNVYGEGLLLEPKESPVAQIVALPDADWTPEMLTGMAPGLAPEAQFGRILAENGCRVIIPTIIDRKDTWSGNPAIRMTNQPHREFIYRMAFELGRHIIGFEVQKVLVVVDWFSKNQLPIGVFGYGEGGLLALYSSAADTRIDVTLVSGYFQSRQRVWEEPIYRNVWRLLREFGDAELTGLIAPRTLIIEASDGPKVDGPPLPRDGRSGAAPGKLASIPIDSVEAEFKKAREFYNKNLVLIKPEKTLPGSKEGLSEFLFALGSQNQVKISNVLPVDHRKGFYPDQRLHRQFDQLVDFTQHLLRQSVFRRREFWDKADKSSLEAWKESVKYYREYLWNEVIGKFPPPDMPINPKTRLLYNQPKWIGYEVMLDVWKDVFAYGILLIPKDIKPGERRPVVVCQHGLEGRPDKVANPDIDDPAYQGYGAKLADLGFVVYAPQNPYIGMDDFRLLQRKANPLGCSLFSVIVRQHQRTLEWLSQLPYVDEKRIGFYGISYGGKTAMRVPALLEEYALSICSADFNDWIVKNTTYDYPYSYVFTGEYEMFEFDLGNTFNYSDMAGLILPRPFMVERGHHDGVAPDEWVAYEYAAVRRLYAILGIPERTDIEFFNGGHKINAQGTFEFLKKWLHLH